MSDKSVDILMARGFDLLEDLDFEGAVKVGEKLRGKRHSSAFEILALAHNGLGNIELAIEILEDGTRKAPTVWVLWQLLGNYRSDLERYAEAHEAYKLALECPDADDSSIHLNQATALTREERFDQAIKVLSLIDDNELLHRAESLLLEIYNRQGKYEEVIDRGERLMSQLTAEAHDDVRSTVQAIVGQAYWQGRKEKEHALTLAWESLKHSHASDGALWLIRGVESQFSRNAKYYRLLVEGIWHEQDEDGRELGFFITYDVVADDTSEAMAYIRRFESECVGESLKIREFEAIEERPTEPKGVYSYTGHHVFPLECEGDSQSL